MTHQNNLKLKKHILNLAQKLLDKPYQMGAPSFQNKSFDCSSLTQYIFYKIGIKLPRSTILQAAWPEGKTFFYPDKNFNYQTGDVLFMKSDRGFYNDNFFLQKNIYIGHAVTYLNNGKIIQASSKTKKVTIDNLKDITKNKNYKIVLVKRYLEPQEIYNLKKISQYKTNLPKYWQKRSCGIISLALIIDFYTKNLPKIDELLNLALKTNSYLKNIGWKHYHLAKLAAKYNLKGKNYDFAYNQNYYDSFLYSMAFLKNGPFIASIYKNFNPKNGGHLIVVKGFKNNKVYITDPDDLKKESVPVDLFIKGFKKRIIVFSK